MGKPPLPEIQLVRSAGAIHLASQLSRRGFVVHGGRNRVRRLPRFDHHAALSRVDRARYQSIPRAHTERRAFGGSDSRKWPQWYFELITLVEQQKILDHNARVSAEIAQMKNRK